MKSLGYPGK